MSKSRPSQWIEENFYIPETLDDPDLRGKIELPQYQKDVLDEALTPGEDGLFKYSIIVWSDIKKSGKSSVAGAVALYMADIRPWVEGYFIANDIKQADSRSAKYARRAVSLSPYLRENFSTNKYKIMNKVNGSFLEAIPVDPEGEAGANPDLLMWCFDKETEVLTKSGWKKYDQLTKNDEYATLSDNRVFEWQKANRLNIKHYSGKMYLYDRKMISIMVTPGHRIYGKFTGFPGRAANNQLGSDYRNSLPFELRKVEEVSTIRNSIVGAHCDSWNGTVDTEYIIIPSTGYAPELKIHHALWAKFMGWYLSEGNVKSRRGRLEAVMIGQSETANPELYQEIWNMLIEMGLKPSSWRGNDSIVVHNSELAKRLVHYGLSGDKYIPDYIKDYPKEYLKLFIDAYRKGDGYDVPNGTGFKLSTKSIKMRDDLLEIGQKCGYIVATWEYVDKRWENNPVIYTVRFRPGNQKRQIRLYPDKWELVDYDDVVWCPSTTNGIVFVRRRGKCYWSGNSELWGAMDDAKERMWSESTLAPIKFGKSFRWVETYAGYTDESEILYSLWEMGVKHGELLWPDRKYPVTGGPGGSVVDHTPLELYVNREARLLCMWNTQPRCPWQKKEYYSSEESTLHPLQFLRMHRNQWVSNTDTYIPMEWWYANERKIEEMPVVPDNAGRVIALDAAVSNDCFGMTVTCRHPDRENNPNDLVLEEEYMWKPSQYGGKIDYIGTIDRPGPETILRSYIMSEEKFKEWYLNYFRTFNPENSRHASQLHWLINNGGKNIIEVAYDPYQLYDLANRLGNKEQLAWFRAFPQGSGKHSRLISDSMLRDMIRDRRVWYHDKPNTTQHLQNADGKIDEQERQIRIVKRTERLKVDLAVCLSMGSYETFRLNM